MALENPLRLFEQGHYQRVIDRVEKVDRNLHGDEVTAVIAASAFLGEIESALQLWEIHKETLVQRERLICRFALGVAATRVSRIKQGHAFFIGNFKELEGSAYTAQGAGFFLYFTGRFERAAIWAKKTLGRSIDQRDAYLRFLATDLLGHCIVQMGRRSEGLMLLEQAKRRAEKHGNKSFAAAFRTARLIYEAEAGWRADSVVSELEDALQTPALNDSYTRNNVVLELARQKTIRGRWSEARDLLNSEATQIYAFGNRRQELTLQLRLAEIAYRVGDRYSVEHFLRGARRCLDGVADRAFEIRLLGLEIKAKDTFSNDSSLQLKEKMLTLSKDHSSLINRQMLSRSDLVADPRTSEAEDPIHHILLRSKSEPKAAAESALQAGFLGLWPALNGFRPGERIFAVRDTETQFIVADHEGVCISNVKLSRTQLRILRALKMGNTSKESLIKKVWGYEYDPLRHDSLIYTALTKLRKTLEPRSQWIITNESGWLLDPNVLWLLPEGEEPSATTQEPLESGIEELNFRQIKALKDPPEGGVWSVAVYKDRFQVSTMTAFRDLDDLRIRKRLARVGKGRATRYIVSF